MKRVFKLFVILCIIAIGFVVYLYFFQNRNTLSGHRVVLCIPVYGQSLALGEEAVRITDFDSLKVKYEGRIMTENLDYAFGYLDDYLSRQKFKKLIHYNKRAYELSIYKMAEELVTQLGEDTVICIFPGGTGMSKITVMNKTTEIYDKFLCELENAFNEAQERGWEFYVPAICWMQGESEIIEYAEDDYKKLVSELHYDINRDIKEITKQKNDIIFISYQSNVVTRAEHFISFNYDTPETKVPQSIVDLIREDSLFWASGPTYPYTFVNEKLHIDAIGQQHIGYLDAIAIMNIIRKKGKTYGLIPMSISSQGNDVLVRYNVPHPPLVIDTINVSKIENYGFNVISKEHKDIIKDILIEGDIVKLKCSQSPINCKVRYAVNGEKMKSGHLHGPRGNLRDSQGEEYYMDIAGNSYPIHNWSYQFDMLCE